jgi:hypothetical protein
MKESLRSLWFRSNQAVDGSPLRVVLQENFYWQEHPCEGSGGRVQLLLLIGHRWCASVDEGVSGMVIR